MNKITLFITLALISSSAQPVTREKLEKARNVTGIVTAVGEPAAEMISKKMQGNSLREGAAAFDSENRGRIQDAERAQENVNVKSGVIQFTSGSFGLAHDIISSTLEKDVMLPVRLMQYFSKILDAKTPVPADLAERLNRLQNNRIFNIGRMREVRDICEITANYAAKKIRCFWEMFFRRN